MDNKLSILKITLVLYLILMFPGTAFLSAQNAPQTTVSGTLDWEKGEIHAIAELNLSSAGIRFPAGRVRAEEILAEEYSGLIKPLLLALQADSSSTIGDLVKKGEIDLKQLDEICTDARKIPPNFTADLAGFSGNYNIRLSRIQAALIRHRQAGELYRPVIPSPAANHTGIIIIADTPLPVHGRKSTALLIPCLFPKIWDTEMNLIYERNLTDPLITGSGENNMVKYTRAENIFQPVPSGLSDDLIKIIGDRPLRIFASSVFGTVPTDPVIDKADVMQILSNENNRKLLREGRVVFVIDKNLLMVQLQ